jgi:uncharacterized protein YmfQ (DUF2313 family)
VHAVAVAVAAAEAGERAAVAAAGAEHADSPRKLRVLVADWVGTNGVGRCNGEGPAQLQRRWQRRGSVPLAARGGAQRAWATQVRQAW